LLKKKEITEKSMNDAQNPQEIDTEITDTSEIPDIDAVVEAFSPLNVPSRTAEYVKELKGTRLIFSTGRTLPMPSKMNYLSSSFCLIEITRRIRQHLVMILIPRLSQFFSMT